MTHHPKRALVSWAVGHFDCGSVVNWKTDSPKRIFAGWHKGLRKANDSRSSRTVDLGQHSSLDPL
jgi:hypothetical protein